MDDKNGLQQKVFPAAVAGGPALALSGPWAHAMFGNAPAQTAAVQTIHTNSVDMQFVAIPAGSLGQYEVTQTRWEKVMGESPFARNHSNLYDNLPGMTARITRPDHPATVSWRDTQKFTTRLNQLENTTHYRLPTEAGWEYAARAGTTTAYSFGDDEAVLDAHAWHGGTFATGGTHPVGRKLSNVWGLCDIHGNVWEWVNDWFSPRHPDQPQTDPQGAAAGTAPPPADAWPSATPIHPIAGASASASGC